MKIQAKTISTPVGIFPAPLNPHFQTELEKCETKEDLFAIVVETNGFINPDAINEVVVRGWYSEYVDFANAEFDKKKQRHYENRLESQRLMQRTRLIIAVICTTLFTACGISEEERKQAMNKRIAQRQQNKEYQANQIRVDSLKKANPDIKFN